MKKTENIYVSIQLEKEPTVGDLLLCIKFDKTAPNFYGDKNDITWCPTIEELDFISEAFGMIAKGKHQKEKTLERSLRDEHSRQLDEHEIIDRVIDKKDRTFM